MLYAFGFERFGVVVSDLFFVDPRPLPGQESAERGVRLEVRILEPGELKGSIYSARPIEIGQPVWRADLLEAADGPPGSLDRAHHHPAFRGWEPGSRVFDPGLSADPVGWVGAQLADLEGLAERAWPQTRRRPPTQRACATACPRSPRWCANCSAGCRPASSRPLPAASRRRAPGSAGFSLRRTQRRSTVLVLVLALRAERRRAWRPDAGNSRCRRPYPGPASVRASQKHSSGLMLPLRWPV